MTSLLESCTAIVRDVLAPDRDMDALTMWLYLPLAVGMIFWAVVR